MDNNVRDLRKDGQLDKAYKLGKQLCEEQSDNVWNKRDFAWVCYDRAKLSIQGENDDAFIASLKDIATLELDVEEKMIGENLSWLMGKWINQRIIPIMDQAERTQKIRMLLDIAIVLPQAVPSEGYVYFVRMVHCAMKDTSQYCEMMDRIGFDFLRPEDYQKTTIQSNGKKIMSMAEQLYIAYAKTLIRQMGQRPDHSSLRERIVTFLPQLSALIESHPEYQYPLYYKAKLLLALGEDQTVTDLLIPFVQSKSKDFWVWQILGESIVKTDEQMALSCYCRALLCNAPEEMVVNLREATARLMARAGFYNEARYEFDKAEAVRKEKWGKVTPIIMAAHAREWYKNADILANNQAFYKSHSSRAEDLLYAKDARPILITFVNEAKQIVNFIMEGDRRGFFKYARIFRNAPILGGVYNVVFQSYSESDISKVRWGKKWEASLDTSPFYQKVSGTINIHDGKQFGFVENMFVEPELIEKNSLLNGMQVSGMAVRSFDKKKGVYGWRIKFIQKSESNTI